MTVPGIVLSQALRATTASNRCPRATSSIESAITSRLTRLVFMPLVPIVMPSEMATVLNSIGVPPAARTPSLTLAARARWLKLHGIVSVQVGDADDRLRERLVIEADALQVGAGSGPLGALGERARVVLGVQAGHAPA